MRTALIRKRYLVPGVILLSIGALTAASAATSPTDQDATAALATLSAYVSAHSGPTPTVTVTVTVGPSATPTPSVSTVPPTTASPSPTTASPSVTPTSAQKSWLSGAGGADAASGSFGTWRGSAIGVGGSWDDDSIDTQTNQWTLREGPWNTWAGPLDIAVGGIFKNNGETWAAAATGAYDSRWTTALNNIKTKLGTRSPGNLYLRFAHEMNGDWSDWNVTTANAANFRAAMTRFSTLRYQVFGQSNYPKLVMCVNDGTSAGQAGPADLFVATDSTSRKVVDVYCADSYNMWPHRTTAADVASAFGATSGGNPVGLEAHRLFALSHGVPFSVGEWGNCSSQSLCAGGGGEAPEYIKAMNNWFRAHDGDVAHPVAGQLLYEVYFNIGNDFALHPTSVQPTTASTYTSLVWGH
jgi:hypothetical protein